MPGGLDSECPTDLCHGFALIGDRGSEFLWGARINDLPGDSEPGCNRGIGDNSAYFGGDSCERDKRCWEAFLRIAEGS